MTEQDRESAFSFKTFYDKINLVFHAILALPLLAFVWIYLESSSGGISPLVSEEDAGMVNLIMPLVIFAQILLAFYLFRNQMKGIVSTNNLEAKLNQYFSKSMVLYAVLDIALTISVVCYYITLSNVFIGMFVIVMVFFSLNKPTPLRIATNLKLEGEEKQRVINKEES